MMVFRKGGYLAKLEKWFVHGTHLEVGNSYTYLSTKLSIEKGLQNISSKAEKKVMDIFRALWKVGCTGINAFFLLFDVQIQAQLTYAAEVWGATEVKVIERVHVYAGKEALSESQKLPKQ